MNHPEPNSVEAELSNTSWVIVRAGASLFAIPALSVQTMVILPHVVSMPRTSAFIRGVVNLRGRVLPVVDLRVRSGMEPLSKHTEELCSLLDAREQDHRNWLNELTKSVAEKRPFTLTTDPHKCAFGKWYDCYHTDDLVLAMLLKKFDEPHKAIHAVGIEVEALKQAENWDGAAKLIEKTRGSTLSLLIELFASARAHIRSFVREIAVVIERETESFALAVDNVESTEYLDAASISEMSDILTGRCQEFIRGLAKRKKDQQMVLLLDIGSLLAKTQSLATRAA